MISYNTKACQVISYVEMEFAEFCSKPTGSFFLLNRIYFDDWLQNQLTVVC